MASGGWTAREELDPSTSTGRTEEAAVQGDPGNSAKVLNVILLAREWGSSMGGLSTINRKLAILLAKHSQVHVTLLVPEFACSEKDKRDAASYKIVIQEVQSLPAFNPLDCLSFPPKDLAIDIVLGYGAKLGKQAQVIKKSHSCKWVQVVHTAPEELGMYKDYSGAIAKGEEKNRDEVDLCKLSDLVVAVGPKLAEAYSSYLRFCKEHQDIIKLTPGTFHEFTKVKQAARDGGKFKVLTFGRGDPEDFSLRGYDIAAKAVTELKDSSYCLVFVGAPSGKEENVRDNLLQCGISENQLTVRAFVQDKERIKDLFCEVDLAIMPSRTEGFGLTALEALSAGLPILVGGNSGFAHALRDLPSWNSFVVESKDPKEWAKAIASVRQKGRAQRLQEIQTLRTSYEERYSWEDQCGALVEKMWIMAHGTKQTIPPEILVRGPFALKDYKKALADGKTYDRRVPIMLIGQDRAGKTSLKKSLKGICYDPEEDSTVGVDVDPSHFKVSSETWKTGTTNQDDNSDTAISFAYHTARCIVDSLKKEGQSTEVNTATEDSSSSFESDVTEMPGDPRPTEPSGDAEDIQTSNDQASTTSTHVRHVTLDPTERNQEAVTYSTPDVQEVAAVTESILQGDLEDSREDIYSVLWDFAGQSVYYVTHALFLTTRAIYCLVYDLSLNPQDIAKPLVKEGVFHKYEENFNLKTNLDYLDFWMMSVASQASSLEDGVRSDVLPEKIPPVFLVCTHADTPYGGRDPKDLARQIFGYLKSKSYGAQLSGVFCVNNTCLRVNKSECPEVQRLRKEVLAVAKELPHINEAVPIKWLQFEKKLQAVKERGDKYISLETANDIATRVCNINEGRETLMNFLHDLRSLIHFDDTAKLNNTVVLDPQWLVDVFKKVITVKPFDCRETKFLDLWRKLEREGILDEKLLAHVWGPLFENEETCESLIGIMERFSLLCPWPSDAASGNKNYLVPSMLKSHPPNDILELVASAKIPSLFLKFENGQVPPGLFPRLILLLFQWGNKNMWRSEKPQLFHDFARFFTAESIHYSVILMCHSSSVEVVVHGGDLDVDLVDDLSSKMTLSADIHHDTAGLTCARLVRRQLGLMLECMRNEFPWLKNMTYEMSVICPVCCKGKAVDYCQTHDVKGCREEQCLHFLNVSELCNAKGSFICTKSASAKNVGVQAMQFSPWFATPEQQLAVGEHGESSSLSGEENEKNALALPGEVLESLLSTPCDSKQVVFRYMESLQLDQASLEKSELDPETKKAIRCLARKAKCSDRLDVVKHLREITPAGTTGPLLPESLDVREIPYSQARQLSIALTVVGAGGDKWKFVAEKLGLNSDEIRFLDERHTNPAATLIRFIAGQRCLTVGELYKVLCDCGIPVIADKL